MRKYLIYDIETFQCDRLDEFVAQKDVKAASNIKDPEKIKANIEKRTKDIKDKAALHFLTGQVIFVGLSYCGEYHPVCEATERDTLLELTRMINSVDIDEFVGFNNNEFDQPFLKMRYMKHFGSVPEWLRKRHEDLAYQMGRSWGQGQRAGMKDLEWFLGIERDGDKDATQVFDWWINGQVDKIEEYSRQDIKTTEQLYIGLMGEAVQGGMQ